MKSLFFVIMLATGSLVAAAERVEPAVKPKLESFNTISLHFGGPMDNRIRDNVKHWLLAAPVANPAMLQIFRDRDRTPRRDLVPWAGEFAGKYLTSATGALHTDYGKDLAPQLRTFVRELIATQSPDGYFGPFPQEARMTGPGLWDLWGQYHVMLGLLKYAQVTQDPEAMPAALKCADYFCKTFLEGNKRVVQAASEEMNESSIHVFTLLYEQTGEKRYLDLVREIEKDWQVPPSGDYVRQALEGKAFYQFPKPRWEGLHSVQAIAELYFITGDEKYKKAYEQIWKTIREGDRHNTGGFSSGEQATGNPYDPGAIETCCTIAWMAITLDMLRLSGDSKAADELEISTWNAILGAQHSSGRWWTYNTPMDGEKKASAHEIVFQARAGSPELNCCSVNGPRGLGMLSEWALMRRSDGVALNYYGPCTLGTSLSERGGITLTQATDYPLSGNIVITVSRISGNAGSQTIALRIPEWSNETKVEVNGEALGRPNPGEYAQLNQRWKTGDVIKLTLDMSPRLWHGEKQCEGKVSLYHGPILVAYDPRFDTYDPTQLPGVKATEATLVVEQSPNPINPAFLKMICPTADGKTITLCDFASAGTAGNRYMSWLPEAKPQE